jgi:hypothetical protein
MHLESAGASAQIDRYIGYYRPYATSHEDLDADTAIEEEVGAAAATLLDALRARRAGRWPAADATRREPRPK